jgi:hypothetical protein
MSDSVKKYNEILNEEKSSLPKPFVVNNIKPKHYELMGVEVKDILEEVLDKIEVSEFNMSLNEAGWYQQAMQYFLRFYAKNGVEDLEKGIESMKIMIKSMKNE